MQKSTLTHYTVNTKHVRESPFGEITQHDLNLLTPWVKEALQAVETFKVLDMPAPLEHLKAVVFYMDGVLQVSLVSPMSNFEKDMPVDKVFERTIPLVTFNVVVDEKYSNDIWKTMHKIVKVNYGKCPSTPWVAAVIHESTAHPSVRHLLPSTLPLCATFERVVAWTLILNHSGQKSEQAS